MQTTIACPTAAETLCIEALPTTPQPLTFPVTTLDQRIAAEEQAKLAPRESVRKRQAAEIARLVDRIVEPTSISLQRAIARTADLKIKEVELSHIDTDVGTDESNAAWMAARAAMEEAASSLIKAPIANARDAVIRAEAFIDAVGRDANGLPEDDTTDMLDLVASYQEALEWLSRQTPDRASWDEAVAAYRQADRAVCECYREGEGLDRAAHVEEGTREALADRLKRAYVARDTARDALLAMDPPDVGGLLQQIEIVADAIAPGDIRTYRGRADVLGDGVNVDFLWGDQPTRTKLAPALAFLASKAAKLRDRALPSDWQEMLEGDQTDLGLEDAVRSAIDAGLCPDDLTEVVSDVALGDRGPVLVFDTPNGEMFHAQPGVVWKREAAPAGKQLVTA